MPIPDGSILTSTLATAVVAAATAIKFFQEYIAFKIKLKRAGDVERSDKGSSSAGEDERESLAQARSGDPQKVVSANFRLLERYYDQTLTEARLNSRATIVIASLGFVAILVGIGFAVSGSVSVGVVSTAAGLVAEGATVLFFKNNQEQLRQVSEYHKKLVSTQYLQTAIALTEGLDDASREAEVKRIIVNLLYLSNELNGSQSPHLIGRSTLPLDGAITKKPSANEMRSTAATSSS